MDYMETVKQLEEKLVLNEQKNKHGGLVNGKCNGEVMLFSGTILYTFFFQTS